MDRWIDFQLLDAGGGEKLEKWGHYILQRPDPQAIWYRPEWKTVDATYVRSPEGGGSWTQNHVPQSWLIRYPSLCGELRFNISLMGFKHTGLFPEQSTNWDFMQKLIAERKERNPAAPIRILNSPTLAELHWPVQLPEPLKSFMLMLLKELSELPKKMLLTVS